MDLTSKTFHISCNKWRRENKY